MKKKRVKERAIILRKREFYYEVIVYLIYIATCIYRQQNSLFANCIIIR